MVRHINLLVKGREGFRPFAPAVMAEHAEDWFELDRALPYMLQTVPVRAVAGDEAAADQGATATLAERLSVRRSRIPACTHVDRSARVQTVDAAQSPHFHRLLDAFHRRTGCPVLLNTSFNRKDEPIVCSPADALRCFVTAGLDVLVLERCLITKDDVARRSAAA